MSAETKLQIGADAGYCARADLVFAQRERDQADILIAGTEPCETRGEFFGRDRFLRADDGTAFCPAGRQMNGPYREPDGRTKWTGVGCADCALRPQCTKGRSRSLVLDEELDRVRAAMQERMTAPGGRERYNRRIATIEPVFSNLESTMGYRRASSRHEPTILAEVLLKALAHNISRLLASRRLSRVRCLLTLDGLLIPLEDEFSATL